jgi:hypothetical protein
MATDYKKLLNTEATELRALLEQRRNLKSELDKVNTQVSRLREGVMGLAALAGVNLKETSPELFTNDIVVNLGLTDAIRKVLGEGDFPSTPTDVRDGLLELGFPIHKHKNPLASIHSVLKRLIDAGQVVPATEIETQKTVYMLADSYHAHKLAMEAEAEDEDIQFHPRNEYVLKE